MNFAQTAFQHCTAPPTFRVALADRPRLLQQLRTARDARVILLDAPAGYGKTWLLGRWYAELRGAGVHVAWLGVEQPEAAQFLALAVAGFARAGLDVGRLEVLAAQGFGDAPLTTTVSALAAALSAAGTEVVVFVDDLHRLSREAVTDILARLIAQTPASVRFACSGRDCSALPRAALRARGELGEIGADELRLDNAEAAALLPGLGNADLERLLLRTEGWPVALQLARMWLEAQPRRTALLDAFSGRTAEVAEYLTEQVLADLPADLQQVLADVAVLERLNPDLVAAVTGDPGAWHRLIEEARLDHFLVPLDEERYWCRLHHLLLEYLRARQRERGTAVCGLHARAMAWFERHGHLHEAVRHAVLAEDLAHAAELVQRTGGWEMVVFGGTVRMRALLGVMPPAALDQFPRIQLYQAFLAAKDGELARALRMFEAVQAAHPQTTDPALARDLLIVDLLIGGYADRPVMAGDLADLYRWLEALSPADEAGRAALLNAAVLMALNIGDMQAAQTAGSRAVREMRRIGSVLGLNYCLLHLGMAQLQLGERREAEATWREAAELAEENFGADSGLKAIAEVYLALALHARGDIAGAGERFDRYLGQVETGDGWVDLYAEAYSTAIENALARGRAAPAVELVERMARTGNRRGLVRLERLAAIAAARLLLLPGLAEACRSRLAGYAAQPDQQPDGTSTTTASAWREQRERGLLRVYEALAGRQSAEALEQVALLEAAARTQGRKRELRLLGALRAAAHAELAAGAGPVADFVAVLEAAIGEDDTQFLVDAGPVLLPLLRQTWTWSREESAGARLRQVLAGAVTTQLRAPWRAGQAGVLSAREIEVLAELASGAPNKLIARYLQMTENTVKFHLKNIFQKLGVRHRVEALAAARSRGLLS